MVSFSLAEARVRRNHGPRRNGQRFTRNTAHPIALGIVSAVRWQRFSYIVHQSVRYPVDLHGILTSSPDILVWLAATPRRLAATKHASHEMPRTVT